MIGFPSCNLLLCTLQICRSVDSALPLYIFADLYARPLWTLVFLTAGLAATLRREIF